jgi:hypothetical protein
VKYVILFDGTGGDDGWAIPLAALESRGRAQDGAHPEEYETTVRGREVALSDSTTSINSINQPITW